MRQSVKRGIGLVFGVACVFLLFGCTDWQKKYKALNVEHENLKGLYDNCITSLDDTASAKSQLSQELAASQQTIDELRAQMEEGASASDATGFEGMDVAFDPAAGTITVTLPNAILFAAGKADLKKSYISELDQILGVLRQRYWGKEIDVVGHTDSDPIRKSKWTDNWQLSAERALSVLRYLSQRGVAAEKIRAVAAGESRPVASNATTQGKAKNRRVEIVVHMNS